MQAASQFVDHIFDNLDKYGTIASALITFAGATFASKTITEFIERAFANSVEAKQLAKERALWSEALGTNSATPAYKIARGRAISRLDEASKAMFSHKGSARIARIASILLTVGQYIIGGVLASSFLKDSPHKEAVVILGVLVLISALVKQHFHPEVTAEVERTKASQLQALIRTFEDQIAVFDGKVASGQDHSDAMIQLLTKITQTLTEIENPEAGQLKLQSQA